MMSENNDPRGTRDYALDIMEKGSQEKNEKLPTEQKNNASKF